MKKKAMLLLLVMATAFFSQTMASAEGIRDGQISVFIEGEKQTLESAPIIQNGRVLVPLRGIFEGLGADVAWNGENRSVSIVKENNLIELKIGSYFAAAGDKTVKLDVKPIIIEDRTMIPLRFISEALGYRVAWEPESRTVSILTEKPQEAGGKVPAAEVLTYERALELAIANSYDLRAKQIGFDRAEELNDSLFVPLGSFVPSLIVAKAGLRAGESWAERQIELAKETLALQVRTALNEIVNLRHEERLATMRVANSYARLRIAEIRAANGLESEFGLDAARKGHEHEKQEKQILQKTIEGAYIDLDKLLGIENSGRYEIKSDLEFKPLENIDLEQSIRDALYDDPYIGFQEQQLKNSELGLLLYEYNAGGASYRTKEIDVSSAKNTLVGMKADLEKTIRSRYNQIRILEGNYALLEQNLDRAESSLRLLRVQYDVGMAIELQLKEAELAVAQLEKQLKELTAQHEQLKALFFKPYLSPAEYM